MSDPDPDAEKKDDPRDVRPSVEVNMSFLQGLLRPNLIRTGPGIKIAQAEEDGNEQHQHERKHAETRLQHTPGGIAPAPAGQRMDHGHQKTPEGQAQPE